MFANAVSGLKTLIKSTLAVLAGATGTDVAQSVPPAQGSIQEIEPGDGPRWGTLSGLAAHPTDPRRLYAVTDGDSSPVRIVEIELAPETTKVVRQINVIGPGNDDLDPEGIAASRDGGFWLASEGGEKNAPANRLLEIDPAGKIVRTLGLPGSLAPRMGKKGFEGVTLMPTTAGERLVVAFQAPLEGDPPDCTRIGVVEPATGAWSFYLYPLDQTGDGDLTGLSEIVHLRDNAFAAIERDGKGGKKSIKWITTFELAPNAGTAPDETPPLLVKRRAADLVPLFLASDRKVEKEVEGLALAANGQVYAITDNDNQRATVLLRLGHVEALF